MASTPPTFGLAIFGDLPFALLAPSGIVTVSSPSRHLGETAARLLLDRIRGDDQLGPDRHAPRHVDLALTAAGRPRPRRRRPTMTTYAEYAERTIPGHCT